MYVYNCTVLYVCVYSWVHHGSTVMTSVSDMNKSFAINVTSMLMISKCAIEYVSNLLCVYLLVLLYIVVTVWNKGQYY